MQQLFAWNQGQSQSMFHMLEYRTLRLLRCWKYAMHGSRQAACHSFSAPLPPLHITLNVALSIFPSTQPPRSKQQVLGTITLMFNLFYFQIEASGLTGWVHSHYVLPVNASLGLGTS